MRILKLTSESKKNILENLLKRSPNSYGEYESAVNDILSKVKTEGDKALFQYTKDFDKADINSSNVVVTQEEIDEAYNLVDKDLLNVIRKALVNIRSFHEKQKQYSWFDSKPDGTMLGQKVTALSRVGVYVPGGKAAYPSSVLMNVIPAKVAGVEDDTVEDVVVITEEKKQKLKDVFWDMHEITSRTETVTNGETSEKIIYITINTKTKGDMIAQYGFTRKQQEALDTLLEQDEVLISATHSLAISDGTAQDILKNLPDSLSPERKKVIKAACSLVGKVNYFWGGKSSAIGWDSEWGKLKTVSAEGSKTTGTKRPFGLDCSGFVTWSFINSGFSASAIGHGTQGQIAKCSRISWNQAQAGDLAFLSDLSHVGIIAGKDTSGNILVIHCSSGANNVVITTNSIFGFAARPNCY